ncbi:hypothetical protein OSTOST_20528, partial [Ostertagia ostertagi]
YGYETAVWCQRYELFCNEKQRRNKASELVTLMDGAVKVHYRCMHLFNLPKVICDPFRRQFDYNRCTKGPKKVLTPTPEDQKLAEKIAEEEKALERLLKEKENEDKG